MIATVRSILGIVCLFFSLSSHAATLQFTLDELVQKLAEARASGNPASQVMADKINSFLIENQISIVNNSFVIQKPIGEVTEPWVACDVPPTVGPLFGGPFGIYYPDPWALGVMGGVATGSISAPQSTISVSVNNKRISANAHLEGKVSLDSTLFVVWGWKYFDPNLLSYGWKCWAKKKDKVDVHFDAIAKANATLIMEFQPYIAGASGNTITIKNNFLLQGSIYLPDFSGLGATNPVLRVGNSYLFEDNVTEQMFKMLVQYGETHLLGRTAFKDAVVDPAMDKAYQDWLQSQQERLISQYGTFTIDVNMPQLDDEGLILQIQDFLTKKYGYLDNPAVVNSLYFFVKNHAMEILVALLMDDQEALDTLMVGAGCEAIKGFETTLNPPVMYELTSDSNCRSVNPFTAVAGTYYSDSRCKSLKSFKFTPPDRNYFCRTLLGRRPNLELGGATGDGPNGTLTFEQSKQWTVSFGNRLNILAETNVGTTQPFMQRVEYRTITPEDNTKPACNLEMRIYMKDVNATGLQPLMMIHGGSWKYRSPFFALEPSISRYTDAGFVVFVPFYRLVGNADGSPGCNGASGMDVVADVEEALTWVLRHKGSYGAVSTEPVALAGQSAGAHLAGWLVTHRPGAISRALLLYPPSDVLDFVQNLSGQYASFNTPSSLDPLNAFYKVADIRTTDLFNPPPFFVENSFLRKITSTTPAVFLLHGSSDSLIPSNQSVLLCNAYGGSAQNFGGGPNLRAQYACGKSNLHLFEYGKHGLDACIRGQSGEAQSSLCLSGNDATADLVADSLATARTWLRAGFGLSSCTDFWCSSYE